ncbi:MAG: HEAT repeat domain-containing protein, partial [Planctomycetota bacterium]
MSSQITHGRYPTLAEVRAYYAREEFLEFLLRTCAFRGVVMVIPERRHWVAKWKENRVVGATRAELHEFVQGRIDASFPDAPPDQRLPFYPSFHQSVGQDAAIEADPPMWRDSFRDVWTFIDVLREHQVPVRITFSGSRSLHVLVPRGGQRIRADRFGESQAHAVPILRMPYSLNEDTGLVSLLLVPDEVPTFRPWQASLHVVEFRDDWLDEPSAEERERTHELLAAVHERRGDDDACFARRKIPEPVECIDELKARAAELWQRAPADASPRPASVAWRCIGGDGAMTPGDLRLLLAAEDQEARWLALEAFFLHGTELPADLVGRLATDEDALFRAAGLDVLTRFPQVTQDYALAQMQTNDMGAHARSLHVLGQSEVLRAGLLETLRERPDCRTTMLVRLACVTGVVLRNWPTAWELVRHAESAGHLPGNWPVRVQALRLIEQLVTSYGKGLKLARAIGALGPAAFDLVMLCVTVMPRHPRLGFLRALALLGDERAIDVYIEALGDSYCDSCKWGTIGLMKVGATAVPLLVEAAASDEVRLRRYAVRCLGHMGELGGREAVLGALEDGDARVRYQAVVACRHYATEAQIPVLKAIALRDDWRTRCEASDRLLELGDVGHRAIEELAFEDDEPVAAGRLWNEGDPRGKQVVLRAIEAEGDSQMSAVMALAQGPEDPDAVGPLCRLLPDLGGQEQSAAADALVRLHDPQGLEALAALSRSENVHARRCALEHLARWGTPEAVAPLVAGLYDEDGRARIRAVGGLADLGPAARPALQEARAQTQKGLAARGIRGTLNLIDAQRRLASGEDMNAGLLDLILHCPLTDRIGPLLRARDRRADFEALASKLGHPESGV